MRLSSMGVTATQAEQELVQAVEQDAALIGRMQVIDVTLTGGTDKTRLVRRMVFDDVTHLNRYLELLGLSAAYKPSCRTASLTVAADRLDLQKLTRLGRFFEKQESGKSENEMTKNNSSLVLQVTMDRPIQSVEPAGRRDSRHVSWQIAEENFNQPLKAVVTTKRQADKPLPIGRGYPANLGAAEALRAALPAEGVADFTRRMGGRLVSLVHVRLDDKLNTDLAWLTPDDEIAQSAADYHRRLDAYLLPELGINYYEWLEVLSLDGQRIVAEGYRTRRPFAPKDLPPTLAVSVVGKKPQVAFTPPKLYIDLADEASGQRVVTVLVVTFPSGKQKHRAITVADVRAGKAMVLADD
jgi:hypothetical protein